MQALAREVIEAILADKVRGKREIHKLKVHLAGTLGLAGIPSDGEILAHARDEDERQRLLPHLRVKPTRSLSGVAIVTVQTAPADCPHGTCVFCPGGEAWGTAKAYTGREPAALRAARHGFDAYGQVAGRLRALEANGHPVDKIELIVQGGTFPALDWQYQRGFVEGCFAAMNDHPAAMNVHRNAGDLALAHAANESAAARCIGLTIETKPDWCLAPHVDRCLELGATRIELGVQTTHDELLARANRGHGMAETIEASRVVKDAGLKLCYHMMPGLPGSTAEKDLESFRRLFDDPALRPDMLKIYPTLVVPGTPLHALWKRGDFVPMREEETARLLARVKTFVPPWVRVMRVDRDIPTPMIADGVTHTNLRQMVAAELSRAGGRCRCIRCREAGLRAREGVMAERLELLRLAYESSRGTEHFLSMEDPKRDVLAAFVRVREPSGQAHREEVRGAAIVRELRVVGQEVPIGTEASSSGALQHRGLGRALMEEAEALARKRGHRRVAVTSGVGVRLYYAKLGYRREGPYMVKDL
ncbi:MAG TPA: tRNA uridine(34) 5-carboxymethylaminomethyl modification radical SAM/GNAT enzyme Elp3 [Candidatus Thermoplasmatota archaeon]|nr:tRNA uridine(34) 5-carboxymethylaminomethyl modification radical SAM/GNAT enzyme Elp3 [Candidatus Thermoplasmatota archaeon]